jgi:valyl-tRNA synthetase
VPQATGGVISGRVEVLGRNTRAVPVAELAARVDGGLRGFEFGETARSLYEFFWNEFCDWYIELAKPRLAVGGAARETVLRNLVFVLDSALRLLHPMMPFVTEEIWQRLPRTAEEAASSLMVAPWPTGLEGYRNSAAEAAIAEFREVVVAVRAVRARYALSSKARLDVAVRLADAQRSALVTLADDIRTLAGIGSLLVAADAAKPAHAVVTVTSSAEVYVSLEGLVDFAAERERVTKELAKVAEELARLKKKLGNEGFLAKAAPEIIAKDRARASELAAAAESLAAQLVELSD